ncbi:hypothetical protein H6P81_006960 [Aristolochia fimbriata]|uniref:Ataxin 2 SM domain-containing protein n=1 Tax=Aristolochia fimbriata TaxID=158543 RepID=A0AAV7F004_ARIFI|nr:hypothetical protein H6P81_006960 [Aristolochia fimbriata]
MACRKLERADEASVPELSDALLFTTMCIVGLPVEVQVKDGTIYSGIFHTACVEEDYGVVLMKARMTKKGRNGSMDGVVSNEAGDDFIASEHGQQETCLHQIEREPTRALETLETEFSDIGKIRCLDQVEDTIAANSNNEEGFLAKGEKIIDVIEREVSDSKQNDAIVEETSWEDASSNPKVEKMLCEVECCMSTSNTSPFDRQPEDETLVELSSKISSNEETCASHVHSVVVPQSQHLHIHKFSNSPSVGPITANGVVSSVKSNAKEFKLNPAVPATQPGVEVSSFAPRASVPVKFVQYNNMMAGNVGTGSQYGLPIVGHIGSRQQHVRYSSQYPAGLTYLPPNHPNSQAVTLGRLGQVVYMHPISHDVIQGAPALSLGPGCHLLATPHQPHLPKHKGTVTPLQLCMTPPLVAGGQQPIALPAQLPFSQPVPPVPVVPSITSVFGCVPLVL